MPEVERECNTPSRKQLPIGRLLLRSSSNQRLWRKKSQEYSQIKRPGKPFDRPAPMKYRICQNHQCNHAVIQRKNTQGSPHIEIPGTMRRVRRIKKNSRNQEPRKHEEHVNPRPSPRKVQVVLKEHHQKRNRPKAVQRRIMRAVLRLRLLSIPSDRERLRHDATP